MRERTVRPPHAVQSTIRSLHPELKRRVRLALDLIREDPEAGKVLRGELEGWRSLRVSRLRIVYRELHRSIEVAAIGPRASIYVETERRLRRGPRNQPGRAENSKGAATLR